MYWSTTTRLLNVGLVTVIHNTITGRVHRFACTYIHATPVIFMCVFCFFSFYFILFRRGEGAHFA